MDGCEVCVIGFRLGVCYGLCRIRSLGVLSPMPRSRRTGIFTCFLFGRWAWFFDISSFFLSGLNLRLVTTLVFFYWRGAKQWEELVLLENRHDFSVTRVNMIFVLNFADLLVEMKQSYSSRTWVGHSPTSFSADRCCTFKSGMKVSILPPLNVVFQK